ncbi:MAG: hypothetical protein IH568_01660 [Burkholderiaceae bacterium]|nr:hypothetical protein [Burkholderiaceae bacterium]
MAVGGWRLALGARIAAHLLKLLVHAEVLRGIDDFLSLDLEPSPEEMCERFWTQPAARCEPSIRAASSPLLREGMELKTTGKKAKSGGPENRVLR